MSDHTPDDAAGNVLRFELDLDALTPWTAVEYDYSSERETPTGPPDLLAWIVDRAAAQMLEQMDRNERYALHRAIGDAIRQQVDVHAERIVRSVLDTAVVVGQPGLPDRLTLAEDGDEDGRPLHEVVEERCREWLNESIPDPDARDQYGAARITRLAVFARDASKRKVTAELREAFDEGRAQVQAALREQGAAILQEAIERQAKGVL